MAGATGALGRAIVDRLRDRGLVVLAIARDREMLAGIANGNDVIAVPGDLADDGVSDSIAAVLDGPVRIIVQAAGLPGSGDVDRLTGTEIATGMDIKIGGFLRLIRGATDYLTEGSRLVALGGHYGVEPSAAAPLAGMANAALNNLVRSLADRWGPRGVTVHVVAPGPVESPRMTGIAERIALAREGGATSETVLDEYRASSPLGRLTTVDEVAWAVDLLVDPEAAALLGSVISLDGGRRRSAG